MRYIDALRGIAALLVVWLHAAGTFGRIGARTEEYRGWFVGVPAWIDVGHVGVVVFFLVSGFVIPFSIRRDGSAPVSSFLIKRFFRLFPAYWLSVPLAAVAIFWIWHTAFGTRELLINLTMLQSAFNVQSAEGVYWTLPVEWTFYFLCVLLLWLRSLFEPRRIALLALLLLAVFAALLPTFGHARAPIGEGAAFWFLNLSVMLWGTLYRSRVDMDPLSRDRAGRVILWGLFLLYVAILPVLARTSSAYMYNTMLTYIAGFAIFVVGTSIARIETRLTDWLGRISYSIYLFHSIVFLAAEWWLLRQPADSWWRDQAIGVYVVAGVAITLAVASVVYAWVERPGIRLGHRLAARIGAPRAIVAGAGG